MKFFLNDTWIVMSPGDCVYSPRGSVHAFKNETDETIRLLIHAFPSGIEHFLAEAAEEWAKPEPRYSHESQTGGAWRSGCDKTANREIMRAARCSQTNSGRPIAREAWGCSYGLDHLCTRTLVVPW